MLLFSVIRPLLDYGNVIWVRTCNEVVKEDIGLTNIHRETSETVKVMIHVSIYA